MSASGMLLAAMVISQLPLCCPLSLVNAATLLAKCGHLGLQALCQLFVIMSRQLQFTVLVSAVLKATPAAAAM